MFQPPRGTGGNSLLSSECTQTSFVFEPHGCRQVVARFDGGAITSDAGALLLRQVDQDLDLLPRLAACFDDRRDPQRIEHSVEQLVSQLVYALALGYEDLNDHDELRSDPLPALLAGKKDLEGQENPRYLVTSLGAERWEAQALYEEIYCRRGERENRIKEQLSLFADRMSTETMRANQLRLYLSSLAYGLVVGLRRLGLAGTRWARAQTETIRRVLLKVGAPVRGTVRKVWVSMASGYAYVELFGEVYEALRPPGEKPLGV